MKHYLLLTILVGLLVSGCNEKTEYDEHGNMIPQFDGKNAHTIVIEGCQYLKYTVYRGTAITHKGNCNNPIHYQYRKAQRIDSINGYGEGAFW